MMAMSNTAQDELPSEIEALLPWHAAGTLRARDARRVEKALASDPDLARQYATIQDEYAETALLNDSLGAPSSRVMHKLFAAIDAEPARNADMPASLSGRAGAVLAYLSPRALTTVAALGAVVLLLQAGVIGAVLMKRDGGALQMLALQDAARSDVAERLIRAMVPATGPQIVVSFVPDARVIDIAAFLGSYEAVIVDGDKTGSFRIQVGNQPLSRDESTKLITRLGRDRIVSRAIAAQ